MYNAMEAITNALLGTPNTVPSEQVYKVFQMNSKQQCTHILIFNGNEQTTLNLNEWFSDIEIAGINENRTVVSFTNNVIHSDDTIRTIKWKVLDALKNEQVSYPEIYLYAKQTIAVDLLEIYNQITHNDKIAFHSNMLAQLLQNLHIDSETIKNIPTQDEYTFEQLFNHISSPTHTLNLLIGQRFATYNDLLYCVDPYDNISSTENPYKQMVDNNLITFEDELLLQYGVIDKNNLYLCMLPDVIEYTESIGMTNEYIIRLYYPVLANKGINTKQGMDETRQSLLDADAKLRSNQEIQQYNSDIDTLYDIYNQRTSELTIINKGIKRLNIVMHPETSVSLPLEVIFKNIHATKEMPFVKYIPGSRQENIYRLYCEKITKSGSKIPVLKKSDITKLSKMAIQREILLYISNEKTTELFISICHNGNIRINGEFNSGISSSELDEFLRETVNGIINTLNTFLQQTGYTISNFISASHHLIEAKNIDYVFEVKTTQHVTNFKSILQCLTTVFEINQPTKAGTSTLTMNYKRVGNYTRMNAMETRITRIYQESNNPNKVIEDLMVNFNITNDEAISHFTEYLNKFNRVNGRYVNKSIDILENNGFSSGMQYFKTENRLIVTIVGIDNIGYIPALDIYIDSFCRILLDKTSTSVSSSDIETLCKDKRITHFTPPIEMIIPKVDVPPSTISDEDDDESEEEGDFIFFEDDEEDNEEDNDETPDKDEDEDEGEDEDEDVTEENNEEEDDDEDTKGGAKKKTDVVTEEKEITNKFYNKMRQLEPNLILARKDGQFNAYSRVCPANVNRQPIILTNEEKNAIDKDHRGAYGYALRYGYSEEKEKQHWFICPRYWCATNNVPLTEQDVKDGKCAKEDLHEFTGKSHIKDGEYKEHNPGLVTDAHPTHGVPCCFGKNWDSKQLKIARNKWGINNEDIDYPNDNVTIIDSDSDKMKKIEDTSEQTNFYIVGPEKFPIVKQRWGFLPSSVQLFLGISYSNIRTKKSDALIKPNEQTFLRYGVENSQHQSFVGCIADIYASVTRLKEANKPTPSIKEMREILASSVTLDMYLQYQNGSLVSLFQPKRRRMSKDILAKYENTLFYSSLQSTNDAQMNFYEDTVSSFEHFLEYLHDDDAMIDHTYLWDIVTSANNKLFPTGLNMILLQITDDDITDDVELICPTNSYASNMYDVRRETVIILKKNNFYEPVYMYKIDETDSGKVIRSNETFPHHTSIDELKPVLQRIKNIMNKYCKPRPSMPNVYKYKTNHVASKVSLLLKSYNYIVESQIVNYRRKVIGIMVKVSSEHNWSVFIPCLPSSILPNIAVKYTDEVVWTTYLNTRDTMLQIAHKSEGSLLSRPMLKVIEDELIVGLLTETNQFVQIDPPTQNVEDGIPEMHTTGFADNGYINTDKELAISDVEDTTRLATIRSIKLEDQFYSAFRTTLRIALGQHSNYEIRQKILSAIDNATQSTYRIALNKIELLIREILKSHVIFAKYKATVLQNLKDIMDIETLYKKDQYCLVAEDRTTCMVVIPKNNLITDKANEIIYFKRISDELLRYKQVRLFVLEPNKFLNIGNSEYKLNENELLLLQTLLDGNYFDNLIPIQASQYVKNVTFDTADPSISQTYSSEVSIQEQASISEADESSELYNKIYNANCIKSISPAIPGNSTNYWKMVFPSNSKEITFNRTVNCTYYVLIHIIFKHTTKHVHIHTIKQALWKVYSQLMPTQGRKILQILQTHQIKHNMIKKVLANQITFEDLIMSEGYFITDLDLWAIASYFNLPILLFTNVRLSSLNSKIKWVIIGGNAQIDNYYCIRSPMDSVNVPEYHLIDPVCKLVELKGFDKMIGNPDYAENNLTFETYLSSYVLQIDEQIDE